MSGMGEVRHHVYYLYYVYTSYMLCVRNWLHAYRIHMVKPILCHWYVNMSNVTSCAKRLQADLTWNPQYHSNLGL